VHINATIGEEGSVRRFQKATAVASSKVSTKS